MKHLRSFLLSVASLTLIDTVSGNVLPHGYYKLQVRRAGGPAQTLNNAFYVRRVGAQLSLQLDGPALVTTSSPYKYTLGIGGPISGNTEIKVRYPGGAGGLEHVLGNHGSTGVSPYLKCHNENC